MRVLASLLAVLVTIPIWLILLYKMLTIVGATELMWFLYWLYVPATLVVSCIMVATKE